MDTLTRNQVGPGCKTPAMVQKGPLDLIETGKGLKVQTDKPHLVSLGSGRLSTAITLVPLEEGRTVIGSAAKDIALQGPGLAPEHCYIENLRGTLTLYPCGNACAIDGLPVRQPTRLTQADPGDPAWPSSLLPALGRVLGDSDFGSRPSSSSSRQALCPPGLPQSDWMRGGAPWIGTLAVMPSDSLQSQREHLPKTWAPGSETEQQGEAGAELGGGERKPSPCSPAPNPSHSWARTSPCVVSGWRNGGPVWPVPHLVS
uniref:Pleckstrin homology like domain family B member 1 n=1 Tax=Myotis myotis TaxID=51298 RepID=A0A7J7VJW8_MYOMY|nr:pleckstrin homology like domain family B member 1 [Myotis myotis]